MSVSLWLAIVVIVVAGFLWWACRHKVVVPAPKPVEEPKEAGKRSWTYKEIVAIQGSLSKERDDLFHSKDVELAKAREEYGAKFEDKDFKPKIIVNKKHYVPWIKYGDVEFAAPYVMEMTVTYQGSPPSMGYQSQNMGAAGYSSWGSSHDYFDPSQYASDMSSPRKSNPWKGTKETLEGAIRSYFQHPSIREATDATIQLVTLTGTKILIHVPKYHLEAVYCDLLKKWQEYR